MNLDDLYLNWINRVYGPLEINQYPNITTGYGGWTFEEFALMLGYSRQEVDIWNLTPKLIRLNIKDRRYEYDI